MQNVSTRRVDRITSDEEERMRFGYDLLSSYQYARDVDDRPILTRATYSLQDEEIASAIYAPTATLWRINLGWRRRKDPVELGFRLNLENGRWSAKDPESASSENGEAEATGEKGQFAAVVPFVEDRRNALILSFAANLDAGTMASLLYALKRGIATRFQLEDSELDGELVPDHRQPSRIFFYEAAEGGAGVLSRLAEEPCALAEAARAALEVCHFHPETGEDHHHAPDALDVCEAACYACLLSYTNQRFHEMLDRHVVRDMLLELAGCVAETSGATQTREQTRERLLDRCESNLERCFVEFLDERGYALPDDSQRVVPDFGTRPDFFYMKGQTCVYVDGPYHEYPERQDRDKEVTSRLEDGGYTVVRFSDPAGWQTVLRDYAWIFGEGRG
jgi:very-short-patch-repair endonuclease